MALKLITPASTYPVTLEQSGIYAITCVPTGKVYIGSAVSFKNRFKSHLSKLRLNKHHSPYLQQSWNKHGEENFRFEVVQLVSNKQDLIAAEQLEIDSRKSADREFGFNACPVAGSPLGRKASPETKEKLRQLMLGNKHLLGRIPTEQTLEKLRTARVGRTPSKGMAHTEAVRKATSARFKGCELKEAHKQKIAAAKRGLKRTLEHTAATAKGQARFTEERAREVKLRYESTGFSMRKLALEYGCSAQTVCNIIHGNKGVYQCL